MADLQKIADDLSGLTVIEASELTKILEEKWGVSAAAPVAVAAPSGQPAGDAAVSEEKTEVEMNKLAEYFAVCTKSDPDIVKGDIALICSEEVCVVVNKYLDMATQAMKDYFEKLEE